MNPISVKKVWVAAALIALFVGTVLCLKGRAPSGPANLPEAELSKAKGPANAPVRIVEYSNFQCSACREVWPEVQALLAKYPGKIRFEFRHFPVMGSELSFLAHVAAECAGTQGRFWDYHDRLFKDQSLWSSPLSGYEIFIAFAQELGLDGGRFAQSFFDPKTRERVQADWNAGNLVGVRSTPTFFIQDRVLVGPHQFREEADRWVQEALAK